MFKKYWESKAQKEINMGLKYLEKSLVCKKYGDIPNWQMYMDMYKKCFTKAKNIRVKHGLDG